MFSQRMNHKEKGKAELSEGSQFRYVVVYDFFYPFFFENKVVNVNRCTDSYIS